MGTNDVVPDLSTLKWSEGKDYDWVAVKDDNIVLLFRKYRTHFTIFFKNKYKISGDGDDIDEYFHTDYGCFTFDTDTDQVSNPDEYVDDNFKDLNLCLKDIITLIKNEKTHNLWNNCVIKREKYVEIKNVWDGGEDITSIDMLIFACDELFQKYLELFSENDMFEKVKTLKKGDIVGNYKVLEVNLNLKDDYYHGVGLSLQSTNGSDNISFDDVYSLTRWLYNDIFGISKQII